VSRIPVDLLPEHERKYLTSDEDAAGGGNEVVAGSKQKVVAIAHILALGLRADHPDEGDLAKSGARSGRRRRSVSGRSVGESTGRDAGRVDEDVKKISDIKKKFKMGAHKAARIGSWKARARVGEGGGVAEDVGTEEAKESVVQAVDTGEKEVEEEKKDLFSLLSQAGEEDDEEEEGEEVGGTGANLLALLTAMTEDEEEEEEEER
jgi:hypothetical protein